MLIQLLVVLNYLLLVVLKRVERVEKWQHCLCKHLSLVDVDFHEEGKRDIVEDVLAEVVQSIVRQVFEEFGFFGEVPVELEVVDHLFCARVRDGA